MITSGKAETRSSSPAGRVSLSAVRARSAADCRRSSPADGSGGSIPPVIPRPYHQRRHQRATQRTWKVHGTRPLVCNRFYRIGRFPPNSTACELCSRCRAARSCSGHRGEPCHDFLDLSRQYTHRRFRQCLSGTPGCSMRDRILIRDSSTYTLRGNCAVRRTTVAGTYGGTAITSIRVTRKTANTPPIDHTCLLEDTWEHEHVAIDAGRTRQVRQRLAGPKAASGQTSNAKVAMMPNQ